MVREEKLPVSAMVMERKERVLGFRSGTPTQALATPHASPAPQSLAAAHPMPSPHWRQSAPTPAPPQSTSLSPPSHTPFTGPEEHTAVDVQADGGLTTTHCCVDRVGGHGTACPKSRGSFSTVRERYCRPSGLQYSPEAKHWGDHSLHSSATMQAP